MSVLRAIAHDLNRLAGAHPEKTFPVLRTILERTVGKPHSRRTTTSLPSNSIGTLRMRNCRDCREVLYGILAKESPQRYEVSSLLSGLRQVLTHGSPANPDQEQDGVRQRGVEFFDAIASAACREYLELREKAEGRPLTEEELAAFREAIQDNGPLAQVNCCLPPEFLTSSTQQPTVSLCSARTLLCRTDTNYR